MLNIQEIRSSYPGLSGFDRGILREYLQYKILDIIFRQPIASKLSFIGGTAIRICYGSLRFSEDLDFDNFGLSDEEFISLSSVIKTELELEGYPVEIRNVFKGAFHCHVKLPRILQDNGLSVAADEKILIQIDTVPHDITYQPATHLLQRFEVFRNIHVTPIDTILSMKAAAVFGRKRMKGRDFYDIVYLLGRSDFDYDYLEKKLDIHGKDELREKLLLSVKDLDMSTLLHDVLPFLIRPDDRERVLSFREYITQKLT